MARVLVIGVVAVIVLTVYALIDLALTERSGVRALPRWTWVVLVLLVPAVGPLLWLLVGHARSVPTRTVPPDDDPAFLGRPLAGRPAPERPHEAEIRLLEQELAKLDSDSDDEGEGRRRT